jgi:hypothetical protein
MQCHTLDHSMQKKNYMFDFILNMNTMNAKKSDFEQLVQQNKKPFD